MQYRAAVVPTVLSLAGSLCHAQGQRVVPLASGDSVAIIAVGPAQVPNKPRGFIVRFYPYRSLGDTAELRRQALELRRILRPQLDSTGAPWIVLQATDQMPGPQAGYFNVKNFGFVLEKRGDGQWYFVNGTAPIDEHP